MNMTSKLITFATLLGVLVLPGCAQEQRIVRMVNGKPVTLHRTSRVEEIDKNVPLGVAQGAGALWCATGGWQFGVFSLACFAHAPKEAWPILIPAGIVCGCFSAGFTWLAAKLGKRSYENCTGEAVITEYVQEVPMTVAVANEFELNTLEN